MTGSNPIDLERQLKLGSRPRGAGEPLMAGHGRIPYMSGDQVRRTFLDFFASKGHTVLPSYPLVPRDDPSILWVNCGMAPLKPFFQGIATPPNVRLATSQKSVRLNDIENVGHTPRHHTFFEMLGNFSIGDYFKLEAITWAWELVTEHYRLPPDLLWITVHPSDDEAKQIWLNEVGIPPCRIIEDETNFWDIGPGPCGPNSEIYIDRGAAFGCGEPTCGPLCECGRYMEFYNLVFTQYNHNEDGSRTPLPRKNIDTGMGLERITSIMQGVPNNFETDLLWPLVDAAAQIIGTPYGQREDLDLAMRVIADHVRSVVFAVADGPLPSNDGRGYVIRRLLRRAARLGLSAGVTGPFLCDLVPIATGLMRDQYPEVHDRTDHLKAVVRREEERFGVALREGMRIAGDLIDAARAQTAGRLTGEAAFLLYDTFGFPLDLTEDLAREAELTVDRAGFETEMAKQRRRAREARVSDAGWESDAALVAEALSDVVAGLFTGYDQLREDTAVVTGIVAGGERVAFLDPGQTGTALDIYLTLDRTPFYAESGGQVADLGQIRTARGVFAVVDVQKLTDGRIVHKVRAGEGAAIAEGEAVTASVDELSRLATARNHTATHLLHRALKEVLGPGVNQAGSQVTPERLRFDFTYPEAMTDEELSKVEHLVNDAILRNLPVSWCEMPMAEARAAGAVALFGEKYGDRVRVVTAGDWSSELCGGTHVQATGQIGLAVFPGESSIGSGVRRIEAYTGHVARRHLEEDRDRLAQAAAILRALPVDVPARIGELAGRVRELERANESLRLKAARGALEGIIAGAWGVGAGALAAAGQVGAASIDELRQHSDLVRDRLGNAAVGVLAAVIGDRVAFVVTVGPDLVASGLHAGNIAKRIAAVVDGSGGGKPGMAQAGGRDLGRIDEALGLLRTILPEMMGQGRKE